MDIILETWNAFCLLAVMPFTAGWMELLIKFIPFVLFLELPVYLFILLGVVRYALRQDAAVREERTFFPG
jgi:hypothetical protein